MFLKFSNNCLFSIILYNLKKNVFMFLLFFIDTYIFFHHGLLHLNQMC